MKKIFFTTMLSCLCLATFAQDHSVFSEGYIRDITPDGWLKEFLVRQGTGLAGHPEAMSYPFNTCLWAGNIARNREYGLDWWRYEQSAYYTDGLIRLGYLLRDTAFINKGEAGINYTIAHAAQNGRLGNPVISSLWPMVVFSRAMIAAYQYTGDMNIVRALEKNYMTLSKKDLIEGHRHILNIEGMLWVYSITHNEALLKLAKEAYDAGGFEFDATQAASTEFIHMHGVTYAEMLKLPLLLYTYTGEQRYLDLALNAERNLSDHNMLPDGVYTSAEFTEGNDIDVAHETCDITDYTWSLGYFLAVTGDGKWADKIEKAIFNAGLGCMLKDFSAIQYFSSVNQVIATGNSDWNEHKRGLTWMAFRPTHETECCVGNANRFMPNFVSRMWMTDAKDGGIAAVMYGPTSFSFAKDGAKCEITEKTQYPFSGEITFKFNMTQDATFPFSFRMPGWCKEMSLYINGKKSELPQVVNGFCKVNRTFHNGDQIQLRMEMPVEIRVAADNQGVYFEKGPILLTYAVPQKMEEDTAIYENMNGKVSANPDFKCWSITPTAKFGYAVEQSAIYKKGDKLNAKVKNLKPNKGSYPFDLESAPFEVTIPVSDFDWQLHDNRYNPELPSADSITVTGKSKITLVPYGCTELRLTVFPYIKAK